MDNIEKLKEIIAIFLKIEPSEITDQTIIDQRAIRMSIIWRRMYAALAKEGFKVSHPTGIRTFGDLLATLNINEENFTKKIDDFYINKPVADEEKLFNYENSFLLGIDIEEIKNMPYADDFREDTFYQQNYSPNEISYCVLQKNPLISFAGKFAAKEAIVKADNSYQSIPFNQIEILNNKEGKPYFKDFVISVSHTEHHAVAVAIKYVKSISEQTNIHFSDTNILKKEQLQSSLKEERENNKIAYLAIFISLITLGILLWDKI